MRHPQISDVAVIGISDAQAGEVPKAFVVKDDKSLAAEDIHKYLEGKILSIWYYDTLSNDTLSNDTLSNDS